MCGIDGLFVGPGSGSGHLESRIRRMTEQLVHRGPDDEGTWIDRDRGIGLGFRRLSILDLSAAGHQPMVSPSGRYTMAFNGEVYNFRSLRKRLDGVAWNGHSDTEVILAAFDRWGVEPAVDLFVGMFAIALWDKQERTLTLIRDRLGIKPLYYHTGPGWLSFASELKALRADPKFQPRLQHGALGHYFRYLCVPAPLTIYRNTYKLPPGNLLTIRHPGNVPPPKSYWSIEQVIQKSRDTQLAVDTELVDGLEDILRDAVGTRLESDVPLGAFLSGGIDSSVVTALMQEQAQGPVKTFSIGFEYEAHDETAHAAEVARHLGTDHTEFMVTGREALDVIPLLPDMFDEPLADPSQIPTYLVSKLARQEVTVVLTGDGGDEVFGGYNRYQHGARIMRRWGALPSWARSTMAGGIRMVSPAAWDRLAGWLPGARQGTGRVRFLGTKLHKIADMLDHSTVTAQYQSLLSAWQHPDRLVRQGVQPAVGFVQISESSALATLEERMMAIDQAFYLADDLLAKVDRASMAVSLEARVPLLDHRVIEYAWRMPLLAKIGEGGGKWVLRQVLYRHVPRHIVDRPKMGFSVPLTEWLRGPLREWAEHLLTPQRLGQDDLFEPRTVLDEWNSLQTGTSGNSLRIWTVLMFQAWRDRWLP